jgi:hypothetical protein
MVSEEIKPPTIYQLTDAFYQQIPNFHDSCIPEEWEKFLKECGIRHANMERVKIDDNQKYFLAKIKYGF